MPDTNSGGLYEQYLLITQKAADYQYASAVLGWDQETYMPPKGSPYRGRQLATLASQSHEMLTSESYGDLLGKLNEAQGLSENEKRNVELSLEDYEKNRKLSPEFVERITRQTSDSYSAWIKARKENDYSVYAPELKKMIDLKRRQADMYGYDVHPYDALLDDYEKGASVSMIDPVFSMVRGQLSPLLERIMNARQVDDAFFTKQYPKDRQWDFSLKVLGKMGYDFEAGRQDYAEHPFSTSFAPTDVRITTRVNEHDLSSMLWSSIHEGGHALYELGLPESEYGLPLGAATSLSIHESQSRLWENCVGRSRAFWGYFFPVLQQQFPEQLNNIDAETFYKGMNKVQPSLVRTEADEVTYHFHVMIRYEIEKELIKGNLKTEELAGIWNEYYQKYLGVSSKDDKQGVLQDVHWSHGSFGYFPTYSLGSFYAAQFFEQAEKDISGLAGMTAKGEFAELLAWLRKNIHQYGRKFRSDELCRKITGSGLDFSSFMKYAERKYADIYALK
jgi:carboxypeptidase Taq